MTGERRVLIVAPQPFYQDRGTPIAVRNVAQALTELGSAVDLLTFPLGADVAMRGLRIIRIPNPFGIRHVPVGFSLRKLSLDVVLVAALAWRLLTRRYTRVHAVEEAVFPALVLAALRGVPVVYDMQSSLPEQLSRHRVLGPLRGIFDACERWALRRAHHVGASSGLAARARAQAPEVRVTEWRFATAMPVTPDGHGPALRARLGVPEGAPLIAYVGTFEAYQGLANLVAAMPAILARHPRATLVLVGAMPGDAAALLEGGTPPAVCERVRVVDRQPRDESLRLLGAADVLVSPRAWGDNVPLKIFDYLATGRPIVATDLAAHRALLDEDRAVLVQPTPEALAAGILALLDDPGRAARLGAGAAAYAARNLGWLGFLRCVQTVYADAR